jgi:hypothetical protein
MSASSPGLDHVGDQRREREGFEHSKMRPASILERSRMSLISAQTGHFHVQTADPFGFAEIVSI